MIFRRVVGGVLFLAGLVLVLRSFSGVNGAVIGVGVVKGWFGSVLGLAGIVSGLVLMVAHEGRSGALGLEGSVLSRYIPALEENAEVLLDSNFVKDLYDVSLQEYNRNKKPIRKGKKFKEQNKEARRYNDGLKEEWVKGNLSYGCFGKSILLGKVYDELTYTPKGKQASLVPKSFVNCFQSVGADVRAKPKYSVSKKNEEMIFDAWLKYIRKGKEGDINRFRDTADMALLSYALDRRGKPTVILSDDSDIKYLAEILNEDFGTKIRVFGYDEVFFKGGKAGNA